MQKSEMSKYWLENQKQQDFYKKKLNKYTLSRYFHSAFSYQYFSFWCKYFDLSLVRVLIFLLSLFVVFAFTFKTKSWKHKSSKWTYLTFIWCVYYKVILKVFILLIHDFKDKSSINIDILFSAHDTFLRITFIRYAHKSTDWKAK